MPNFGDFILGNFAEKQRQEMMTQAAQSIFQRAQGQPAQAEGGGALREIPGINQLPAIDQQAAFAQIVATTPGLEEKGITGFMQALQNRAQHVQDAAEFEVTESRLTASADSKLKQNQAQWEAQQTLREAARMEQADAHILKMLVGEQQLEASKVSVQNQAATLQIAQDKFLRLAPADQVLVQDTANMFYGLQQNINAFKPEYAIGALLDVQGNFELLQLNNKKNKTPAEQSKQQFWSDVRKFESTIVKMQSGAQASEQEVTRLRGFIPNINDDASTINSKMRSLHTETGRILESIQARLQAEGFRDIGPQFNQGFQLNPDQGGGIQADPVPEGFS